MPTWPEYRAAGMASLVLACAACRDAGGTDPIHVAPDGDDAAPGTADRPVATLARARQLVRERTPGMQGDVVVDIHAGTYRLDEPLWLTAADGDGGEGGHRVVYQAHGHGTAAAEAVVISGGRVVTGWQLDPASGLWSADVGDLETRQLHVDGRRARRGRIAGIPGAVTRIEGGYATDSAAPQAWPRPEDLELVYTTPHGWDEGRCGVASITATDGGTAIRVDEACFASAQVVYGVDADGVPQDVMLPTAVENSAAFLAEPGTFHLDRTVPGSHRLLYRARPDEDPSRAEIVAPVLETLLGGNGTAEAPLRDVTVRGLTFADTTWLGLERPTGFVHVFGSFHDVGPGDDGDGDGRLLEQLTAAVLFADSAGLVVEDNRFTRLGGQGLHVFAGRAGVVRGNRFDDVAGGGVEVVGDGVGAEGYLVASNRVHDVGVEYRGSVGITVGALRHTTIAHNQVDHLPYCGIVVYPDQQDIRVLDNHVFAVTRALFDGGAIYMIGDHTSTADTPGVHIRGNLTHDVWSPDPAVSLVPNAIYADAHASGVLIEGNAVYASNNGVGGVYPSEVRIERNYWDDDDLIWFGPEDGVALRDNVLLPSADPRAACAAIAGCAAILDGAGLEPPYHHLREPAVETKLAPAASHASP